MSVTHVERLIREKMAQVAAAVLKVDLNDVHRMILLRGQHEGLEQALLLYREANRVDIDGDAL